MRLSSAIIIRPLVAVPRARVIAAVSSSLVVADAGELVFAAVAGVTQMIGSGVAFVVSLTCLAAAVWLWNEQYVLSLRKQRYKPVDARRVSSDSASFVQPRAAWTVAELAEFDGRGPEDGPILLAASELVFNVAPGRKFYGPGGEYSVMAGKDASRYLARNSVEEESPTQAAKELNIAERAALSAWVFSLKQRYDTVGRLVGDEEGAALAAARASSDAYYERMDELDMDGLSAMDEARASLESTWAAERGRSPES